MNSSFWTLPICDYRKPCHLVLGHLIRFLSEARPIWRLAALPSETASPRLAHLRRRSRSRSRGYFLAVKQRFDSKWRPDITRTDHSSYKCLSRRCAFAAITGRSLGSRNRETVVWNIYRAKNVANTQWLDKRGFPLKCRGYRINNANKRRPKQTIAARKSAPTIPSTFFPVATFLTVSLGFAIAEMHLLHSAPNGCGLNSCTPSRSEIFL